MRIRVLASGLLLSLAIPAAPALGQTPPVAGSPEAYIDPSYKPEEHGGLPYGTFLTMSRGTRRRSTGMMVGGIIITSLGAVAMGTGTGIYFGKGGCDDRNQVVPVDDFGRESGRLPCNPSTARTNGMAIVLAGTIAVALGVPLWVLGASDVPWMDAAGQNERAPARPSWARLVPEVTPDRRGASFAWRF